VFERELGLAVVSPDLVGRRRPSPHAAQVHERLAARRDAESRRVLYVAATRARDMLVLVGEAPETGAGEGNWRRLIDAALPELGDLVEVVDDGPVIQTDETHKGAMRWLLDRVEAVRREAIEAPTDEAPRERTPSIDLPPESDSETTDPDTTLERPTPAPESRAELDSAFERSEALHLRDCELEVSLSGLAEFDKCARRYLLTHVVGLDTPANEQREAVRGLALLPFVPRKQADEDDPGDRRPPSLAEARSRGRLVHYLLGRVDLDRLGRDPARTLDGFADRDHIPTQLWEELRDDLLRFAARPWVAELIEIHRRDPRRVLRSLPFALEVVGEHQPPAPAPARSLAQLDLFAPLTTESAPPPQGRVIVRGRVDLVWIDDEGRLNVVDWQYAKRPAERAVILDPQEVAGFRRLTQAWALRRLWGPDVPLRAGAVFLREHEADPGLLELDAATLSSFEQRLRKTAAQLLRTELGDDPALEPWPKLDNPSLCGACIHVGRCWRGETDQEEPPP
jgi:ATP-dependent helicase/nuclease subunit A